MVIKTNDILIYTIYFKLCNSKFSLQSGRFWSIDQQAMLFPAKISEDSPWKQETANSKMDADTENSTQEAIELYFSQHHKITSPDDPPIRVIQSDRGSVLMQSNGSVITLEDMGGSPELRKSNVEEIDTTQQQYNQGLYPSPNFHLTLLSEQND